MDHRRIPVRRSYLVRLARSLTKDPDRAEDLAQEVVRAALEAEGGKMRRPRAWVRAVARHVFLRERQRERLRRDGERAAARPERVSAMEPAEPWIKEAVERLPEPYRSVIRLRFWRGLSVAEIAAETGRPEGTVRSQIKRGLDRLRPGIETRFFPAAGLAFLLALWRRRSSLALPAAVATCGVLAVSLWLAMPPLLAGEEASVARTSDEAGLVRRKEPNALVGPLSGPNRVGVSVSAGGNALPSGPVDVDGIVVDPDGRPIGGAAIWLSSPGSTERGRIVGRSGSDGNFRLRGADPRSWVGARLAGWAPSHVRLLDEHDASSARLRLQLSVRTEPLSGTVVDSKGRAVAGALVSARLQPLVDSAAPVQRPPPLRTRTDLSGSFELHRFHSPMVHLAVRAEGFAPWEGLTERSPARAEKVVVTLERARSLVGAVRTREGRSAAGALLEVFQTGPAYEARTRTGGDGGFAVGGLGDGRTWVRVTAADLLRDGSLLRELDPGEDGPVELELSAEHSVSGVARDEGGAPLSGWIVSLEESWSPDPRGTERTAVTPPDGSFAFGGCASAPHVLRLRRASGHLASIRLEGARPGTAVVLGLSELAAPSAFLQGIFPDGKEILLRSAEAGEEITLPRTGEGAFRAGPVSPGRYRLLALVPGGLRFELAELSLAAHERLDLGALELPRPGSLVVRLQPPAGMSRTSALLELESEDLRLSNPGRRDQTEENTFRFPLVPPGVHRLRVKVNPFVPVWRDVRVPGGAETVVDVPLEAGAPVSVFLKITDAIFRPCLVHLEAVSADGKRTYDLPSFEPPVATGWRGDRIHLPPGEYRMRAWTELGHEDEKAFRVEEASAAPARVALSPRRGR